MYVYIYIYMTAEVDFQRWNWNMCERERTESLQRLLRMFVPSLRQSRNGEFAKTVAESCFNVDIHIHTNMYKLDVEIDSCNYLCRLSCRAKPRS